MFILETFRNGWWLYKVTDEGLWMVGGTSSKGHDKMWKWGDSIQTNGSAIRHEWNVLTEGEAFIYLV